MNRYPSVQQLLRFHEMIGSGKITKMKLRLFMEDPRSVIKKSRTLTRSSFETTFVGLSVRETSYQYGMRVLDLGEIVVEGATMAAAIINFNSSDITREEIAEEMEELGFRPPSRFELTAMAQRYAKVLKEESLLAIFVDEGYDLEAYEGDDGTIKYKDWVHEPNSSTSFDEQWFAAIRE